MKKGGFTLVELLVVIAIIGIISTVAVVNLNAAREKARTVKAQSDLATIVRAIEIARLENDSILHDITGNWYTAEPCTIDGWHDSGACLARWTAALNNIANIAGFDASNIQLDPWGNPYLLDENQCDPNPLFDCDSQDEVLSSGPDGIHTDAPSSYNNDSVIIRIPAYPN